MNNAEHVDLCQKNGFDHQEFVVSLSNMVILPSTLGCLMLFYHQKW